MAAVCDICAKKPGFGNNRPGRARSRSVASTPTSSASARRSTARPSASTSAPAASRPARSPADLPSRPAPPDLAGAAAGRRPRRGGPSRSTVAQHTARPDAWVQPVGPSYSAPSTVTPVPVGRPRRSPATPSARRRRAGSVASSAWSSPPPRMNCIGSAPRPRRRRAAARGSRTRRDAMSMPPRGVREVAGVGDQAVGDVDHRGGAGRRRRPGPRRTAAPGAGRPRPAPAASGSRGPARPARRRPSPGGRRARPRRPARAPGRVTGAAVQAPSAVTAITTWSARSGRRRPRWRRPGALVGEAAGEVQRPGRRQVGRAASPMVSEVGCRPSR